MLATSHYYPSRHDASLLALQFVVLLLSFSAPLLAESNLANTSIDAILRVFLFSTIAATLLSTALFAFGVHSRASEANIASSAIRLLLAISGSGLVLYSFAKHSPAPALSAEVLSASLACAFLGIFVTRTFYFLLISTKANRQTVVVIGTGEKAAAVRDLVRHAQPLRYRIAGYYNPSTSSQPFRTIPTSKLINNNHSLVAFARENDVRTIIVAVDDRRGSIPIDTLLEAKLNGIEVTDVVTFCERTYSMIKFEYMSPSWIVFSSDFQLGLRKRLAKRAFDLTAAGALLVLLSPLMLLIAIASLIESRAKAPIFYTQSRVGYGGRNFKLYKFRSMVEAAEQDGTARWASPEDDRVTPLGKILRRYRLDELPQLFNILNGDMSLVGPRPERPEFVEQLSKSIPYYGARHWVKPGLAGWAQVMYPYGASIEDAKRKLEYDLHYMKHVSLTRDILILLRTAEVVLMGNGVR